MILLEYGNPGDLPSLAAVLGDNSTAMKALRQAHVHSIVPVMLMPAEVLVSDIKGIGPHTATYITGALARHGLKHHQFNSRARDFVKREFGSIEAAPISALHIAFTGNENCTRPMYAHIQLIDLLASIMPSMTVLDLAYTTYEDIVNQIYNEGDALHGPVINRLTGEVRTITHRMSWWDPDLKIGIHRQKSRNQLRLVSSQ